MITTFCLGFFIGVAFDFACRWWVSRRLYLKYKPLLDKTLEEIYREEDIDE